MEISVQCTCGTKYKFDVEPVHGRMPAPVSCPACGADGTVQANDFLRVQASAPPPPPPPPAPLLPPPLPPPMSDVSSSAGAAAGSPPPGGGLRINRPAASPAPGSAPVAPAQVAPSLVVVPEAPAAKPRRGMGVLTPLLIGACLVLGTWRMGVNMFNKIRYSPDVLDALDELAIEGGTNQPSNFGYEDSVVLFVKHPSQTEIAQACKDYWNEKLSKPLLIRKDEEVEDDYGKGLFEVWPQHGEYVLFFGGLDWPPEQFEDLARYLSKRFQTLVFEVREEHDSGPYHFGVYDQGARKFHAEMAVTEKFEKLVFTDGNDWAIANGYRPGPGGFKKFRLRDGDEIAQHLGLKLWEVESADDQTSVWLQELRSK